jgi:cell division initiation protein
MALTPLDIQQQQFPVRFRGFDVRDVDAFLERVASAFEGLLANQQRVSDELQRARQEIQAHREREEILKRAMIHSQKVVEQMKENARKSAELLVAEAEVKAEKILQRAHNRLLRLHEDISQLKRQRLQIEAQVRSVLESHAKLLDAGQEEMAEQDAEDAKLKLLTQPR